MYKSLIRYFVVVTIILFLPAVFFLAGCNQNGTAENETVSETQTTSSETAQDSQVAKSNKSSGAKTDGVSGDDKATENKGGNPVVIIKTNKGDIKIELDKENAPVSTENFLTYVQEGYYDGTVFHRVINNFMVQGGGFTTDMQPKSTKASIKNEADNGLKNERGTIAMARTQDINSATSQFFINHADNAFLDHGRRDFGYAVFGPIDQAVQVGIQPINFLVDLSLDFLITIGLFLQMFSNRSQ